MFKLISCCNVHVALCLHFMCLTQDWTFNLCSTNLYKPRWHTVFMNAISEKNLASSNHLQCCQFSHLVSTSNSRKVKLTTRPSPDLTAEFCDTEQ